MTTATTLPPPKEKPWFKCSSPECNKLWRAYHNKIGCLCHDCDDKTRPDVKASNVFKENDG